MPLLAGCRVAALESKHSHRVVRAGGVLLQGGPGLPDGELLRGVAPEQSVFLAQFLNSPNSTCSLPANILQFVPLEPLCTVSLSGSPWERRGGRQ